MGSAIVHKTGGNCCNCFGSLSSVLWFGERDWRNLVQFGMQHNVCTWQYLKLDVAIVKCDVFYTLMARWSVTTANSFIFSFSLPPSIVSFWFQFFFHYCRVSSCFKRCQTATPFDVLSRFFPRLVWDVMQRLCSWETGSFEPRDYFRRRVERHF